MTGALQCGGTHASICYAFFSAEAKLHVEMSCFPAGGDLWGTSVGFAKHCQSILPAYCSCTIQADTETSFTPSYRNESLSIDQE